MAAAPLVVGGTGADDLIRLRLSGSALTVTVNGESTTLSAQSVSSVVVDAGAGDDRVVAHHSVNVPLVLNGGAGDDHLFGGSGPDSLDGGDGNDVLVSIGGGRDRLAGGRGHDNVWADGRGTDTVLDAGSSDFAHLVASFLAYRIARSDGSYKTSPVPLELAGQDLADPVADEAAVGWKDFSGKPLFAERGPSEHDIDQGLVADCYFLAPLSAVARVAPRRVTDRVADLGDGTYAVDFQNDDRHAVVRVDGELPVGRDGRPAYAELGRDDSTWVAVIEKAWAFYRRAQGTYASISFGRAMEAFNALGVSDIRCQDGYKAFGSATGMLNAVDKLIRSDYTVAFCTKATVPDGSKVWNRHVLMVSAVTRNKSGAAVGLVLRDPHKKDRPGRVDGADDGYITLTADEAATVLWGLTWCKP
jgi:hypothetical protein